MKRDSENEIMKRPGQTVMERLRQFVGRAHAEQSGAIALLLLASLLILFMCAMVIYDAGIAAQDKMDAQIGADSAAYSHTVVKSRSMNMMAYANTIKRMIFSYLATYINAWLAILALFAYHAARCFNWLPDLSSCKTWIKALPMVIIEGIEFFAADMPSMGGKPFGQGRSRPELQALEQYQNYMFAITPWWAYVEGVMRGMTNGALMTASWPVPGESLSGATHVDVLPISRRDNDSTWTKPSDPYQFGGGGGSKGAYCLEYALSLESIVTAVQTLVDSISDPSGWKWAFGIAHFQPIIPSIGCLFAAWSYSNDSYLDFRLKRSVASNRQAWFGATSALHVSYIPRAGRNADVGGDRQKYTYLSKEAIVSDRYKNEGYFAMARSELVYKQPFQVFEKIGNMIGSIPMVGGLIQNRLGLQDYPDMWSPRWKAKNRPMILPGERFGSAIQGTTGLNEVATDVAPYLALGAIVGIVGPQGGDPPFSVPSAIDDFAYLITSTSTWTQAFSNGVPK